MNIGFAIDRLREKETRERRIFKKILTGIAIFVFTFFASPYVLNFFGKQAVSRGNNDVAWYFFVGSEYIKDPIGMNMRAKDYFHFHLSYAENPSSLLSSSYCSKYLDRSFNWMTISSVLHEDLRMERVLCFDILHRQADALAEANIYVNELDTQSSLIVNPFNTSSYSNHILPYLTLLLSSVMNERYDFADKIVFLAKNFSYNKNSNFHLGDDYSPAGALRGSVKEREARKKRCSSFVNKHRPGYLIAYRCVKQGLVPKEVLY